MVCAGELWMCVGGGDGGRLGFKMRRGETKDQG